MNHKKPAKRLFHGVVGAPPDADYTKPDPPKPPAAPSVFTVAEIEAGLLAQFENTQKKKRGRPSIGKLPMTAAQRQERSRAQRGERAAITALKKAYEDRIAAIMWEHRDAAGRVGTYGRRVNQLKGSIPRQAIVLGKNQGCGPLQIFIFGESRKVRNHANSKRVSPMRTFD